jgi:hypothetical protein
MTLRAAQMPRTRSTDHFRAKTSAKTEMARASDRLDAAVFDRRGARELLS